jgi:hypothetical protein
MGIQYFMTLSQKKLAYHFMVSGGSKIGKSHIIPGCVEQPDQDFLIFTQ